MNLPNPADPGPLAALSPLPLGSDPLEQLIAAQPPAPAAPAASVVPFVVPGDFLSAYGLRENPFADCVHPAFFFRTEGHGEAFRSMMLAAEFKTSIGLIT